MLLQSCRALLLLCAAARFFGWLGLGTHPEELGTSPPELGIPPRVPFERTTGDERFQAEATRWEPSPLEPCHHQVVMRLRSSCADLSEEEEDVAKLGVDLSNCHASTEGCRTYPCTPDAEEPQEQPDGQLRPRLETPIHHSLQRPTLDETLVASGQHRVAQLVEDTTQQMGNVSSREAAGLREGHQVVLSNLHHAQKRAKDVCSQLESNLALLLARQRQMEEVMEKLRWVSRSLGLMLAAVEDARSQLENHLQHLHTSLDPAGQSPSAISTCILHGSYFVLLVTLLVPMPPRAILLLLFLASSALGIPALSAFLALAAAGQWLVAATCCGAGGAWLVLPREEPRHWLTSTPERECEMELLQEELDRMEMSCLQEASYLEQPPAMAGDLPGLAPTPGGWRTKLSSCRGLTRAGQRCRKKAIPGQDFCHVHTTSRASCSSLAMDSSPRI
ncbi:PREDICTED: protein brambleberry-like [Nipponia nippon]|uniref:protein brambleberry-like n=1 Tax=Nipponia nippon TaxID=128390 RepID=UPI0005116C3E|nr:PREDICTED: protein brambleberry-like [Nipponia nippon]